MNDEQLLDAFENCRIAADGWTHGLHVRVAYIYLRRYSLSDAIDRMRTGLRAFVTAFKVEETSTTGYNETVTAAWMQIIHTLMREQGTLQNSERFLEEQPQLGSSKLLRLFYSKSIWDEQDCKGTFVAPDLAPLPVPRNGANA
jgi:hypothetical protein